MSARPCSTADTIEAHDLFGRTMMGALTERTSPWETCC